MFSFRNAMIEKLVYLKEESMRYTYMPLSKKKIAATIASTRTRLESLTDENLFEEYTSEIYGDGYREGGAGPC